jgi:hypothetical protein
MLVGPSLVVYRVIPLFHGGSPSQGLIPPILFRIKGEPPLQLPTTGGTPSLTAIHCTVGPPSILTNVVFALIDPTNVFDVIDYWNLRATGVIVFPLTPEHYREYGQAVRQFAQKAHYPINDNVMAHASLIKGRSVSDCLLDEVAEWMSREGAQPLSRQGWWPRYGERGYRIAPELEVSAVVSMESKHAIILNSGYGRVDGPAPECDFSGDANSQQWATELRFYSGTDQTQCYRLPWLRKSENGGAIMDHKPPLWRRLVAVEK